MIIYIVIIIILYLLSFIKVRELFRKKIFWIMIGILAVVAGIRYNVGTDFFVQIDYYNWTILDLTNGFLELGFRYYILAIENIFGDVQFFFIISAIFVVFSFGYGIAKNVDNEKQFFSLALFVTTTIYFATMNLERQYIAIGLFILAFEFLKQKNYIAAIVLTMIAYSLHESAIVIFAFGLLFLWFNNNKNNLNKKYRILHIIWIISLILLLVDNRALFFMLADFFVPDKYMGYFHTYFFTNRNTESVIKFIFPNLVWALIYYDYRRSSKEIFILGEYIPGFFLYLIFNNLFYGINVMLRIGMYFEWFLIYILPKISDYGKKREDKIVIKIGILGYYLALTIYSIFLNGGHGVVPYQSILSNIK